MKQPQTILLIDDHSLITTAMSQLLQSMFPNVQVYIGSDAKDARELAAKHGDSADLMILDLCLPDAQGTTLLEELLTHYPALKILVLSGIADPESILRTLSAGAAGFVPKSLDANLLKDAVNFVLEGGVYIPSRILSQQQSQGMNPQQPQENPSSAVHLTPRQCQVLKLSIVLHLTYNHVSQRPVLSLSSVASQPKNIKSPPLWVYYYPISTIFKGGHVHPLPNPRGSSICAAGGEQAQRQERREDIH